MTSNKKTHQLKHSYGCYLLMLTFLTQISSCAMLGQPVTKSNTVQAPVAEVKKDADQPPETLAKRTNLMLTHDTEVTQLLVQAEQARLKGLYAEASSHYDRVLVFLPDDSSAIKGKKEIERELMQLKKIEKAAGLVASNQLEAAKEIVHEVLIENPKLAQAIELHKQISDKQVPVKAQPPQLKPQFDKPVTLELRDANIKVVFEALSRATGINFILDKDIKPETKATIFIKKARIEDAIDMVLSSNGLQKKALSENTALVFPSTQVKLKDYQDLMIRSFYFTNTDAKQVSVLLKTMLKTKDIFVDERLNMLVMRDTPEVIRIAEKLVAANDLEDPEVMMDIEVLEVSRSRLQELGIVYPNQFTVLSPVLTLDQLKNVTSSTIGVSPNPQVNIKSTTGDVNLLSNPRIRVKNNEKSKVLMGERVPIITTTSTANVGVTESVQYIDVGIKVDVEPRVTLNDYVNIKIGLEVSALGEKTRTNNGSIVYNINTRNANTVLRLKNGETQILAGLILDAERKNTSKLPGLGDIPFLGKLFSNNEDNKNKTEIVMAITPRIISNINLPKAEVFEYWSGTENVITDKQQVNLPVTSAPLSRQDQIKELAKARQAQAQANPDATPEPSSTAEQVSPSPELVDKQELTPPTSP